MSIDTIVGETLQNRQEPNGTARFVSHAMVGFQHEILPILPPDALLHPESKVRPDQRGKIPGELIDGASWVGMRGWTTHVVKPEDIDHWQKWPTANIGLRSARFPGIDVDCSDAETVERIVVLARETLGDAPVRGRVGSERLLLPYRLRDGEEVRKIRIAFTLPGSDEKQAVEILGQGQQYLIEGVHPSGALYRWHDGRDLVEIGADGLTKITAAQLQSFARKADELLRDRGATIGAVSSPSGLSGARKPVGDPALLAPDLAALGDALKAIPNDLDYDSWFALLCAIKAACGGSEEFYFDHVVPWCDRSPKNDHDYTRARWDSIHDAAIGADYIFRRAGRGSADLVFEDDAICGEDASLDPMHPMVKELDDRYFVAKDGLKTFVWEWKPHSTIEGREQLSPQYVDAFKAFYTNRRIVGEKKRTVAEMWFEHPARRTFEGIVFMPGEAAPAGTFHLWRGFAVEPKEGNCTLFKEFLRTTICAGNEMHFHYLWHWMAWAVQRLKEPGKVAIVLRGRQGTGKGFFANQFGALYGQHFMALANPQHLIGKHNDHLEDLCVVFIDEARFDRETRGVLKPIITEPTLTIEPKFRGVRQIANMLHVIMASNEEHVIPADETGEARRFFVLDVAPGKAGDAGYFASIDAQMLDGGRAALLHELLSLDLRGFDVGKAPATAALREQQLAALADTTKWWLEILQTGRIPGETFSNTEISEEYEIEIERGEVFSAYANWAKRQKVKPVDSRLFGKRLADMLSPHGVGGGRRKSAISGERERYYRLPPLGACRDALSAFLGMESDELGWG